MSYERQLTGKKRWDKLMIMVMKLKKILHNKSNTLNYDDNDDNEGERRGVLI
jgi:hypothetical protein